MRALLQIIPLPPIKAIAPRVYLHVSHVVSSLYLIIQLSTFFQRIYYLSVQSYNKKEVHRFPNDEY